MNLIIFSDDICIKNMGKYANQNMQNNSKIGMDPTNIDLKKTYAKICKICKHEIYM